MEELIFDYLRRENWIWNKDYFNTVFDFKNDKIHLRLTQKGLFKVKHNIPPSDNENDLMQKLHIKNTVIARLYEYLNSVFVPTVSPYTIKVLRKGGIKI